MWLIRHAEVYTPERAGLRDILIAGPRIIDVATDLDVSDRLATTVEATGLVAIPGLIDNHVHVAGGGGEGGYATRTPELVLSDAIRGGVTTVVGCLGTDGVTRSLEALLARIRALEEEGLSAFMWTGHYAVPVRTLTGSIERDLLLIDKVIGVGEVALSDHRSTQPTFEEFARLAAEARRGGLLSGKAGIVNVHLGDGPRGLALLRRIVDETELPRTQFLPTHVNRNPRLFDEAMAWARAGGLVDLTTSTVPAFLAEGEVKCSAGLRQLLEAGVDLSLVTFSSDAQGSLPDFDGEGRLRGLAIGRVTSLIAELRDAVHLEGLPLERVLPVATSNPARVLKLAGKGHLRAGDDADIVLLDATSLQVRAVMAKGRWLMREGDLLTRGTFEESSGQMDQRPS